MQSIERCHRLGKSMSYEFHQLSHQQAKDFVPEFLWQPPLKVKIHPSNNSATP